MKIQVVSDLHLEFHNPIPPLVEGVDVAVCAGDVGPVETGAVFYLAREWAEAKQMLYVPGNHEYYGTDIDTAREMLAKQCEKLGIKLLDPSAVNTGDSPQIVNFAVSSGVVSAFLDDEGIPYETAPSDKAVEPVEVAAAATKYTVLVECWN